MTSFSESSTFSPLERRLAMTQDLADDPALAAPAIPSRSRSNLAPCQTNRVDTGWRRIIRNFTPSWFSVTMGTGVVSILLYDLPYNGSWLYYLSIIFFVLNVLLFLLFTLISILRYTLYPEIWGAMIRHPAQSLFLGSIPIGLATIVNMIVFVCVPAWGYPAVVLAWTLWWIDAIIAVSCCFFIPFAMMYFHQASLTTMTAIWLLPINPTIVASASGAIVASVLPNPNHALWTLTTSYVLWGIGIPLALSVLVIYLQRLTIYHLPPREVIVSVFLPIAPLGQGGFAVQQLGAVALNIFPRTHTLPSVNSMHAGEILYVVGWLVSIIFWGFAILWLFFAFACISRSRFPFNMGWWSFTFPLGVLATSTIQMAKEMPSGFFKVLGTVFAVAVTLLWIMVAIGTIKRVYTGELFIAPGLKDAVVRNADKRAQGGSSNGTQEEV